MFQFTYKQDRVFGLDVLRAIAIIFVVYTHGFVCFNGSDLHYKIYELPILLDGVTVFFVLSGFLVGTILIRLIDIGNLGIIHHLPGFWKRRWLRTLPNYYFILFLLILYVVFFLHTHYSILFYLKYIFFIQNFRHPSDSFFSEAWSLSVEEWFYFLFPILCVAFFYCTKKNKRLSILITIFLFLLVPFICRLIYYYKGLGLNNSIDYYREITILRLDSIGFGLAGAFISYYHANAWVRYKKALLIAGISALLFLKILVLHKEPSLFYIAVLRHSLLPIAVLSCLPFLSHYQPTRKSILHLSITHISIISYAMYLLNLTPVLYIILPMLENKLHLLSHNNYFLKYIFFWLITIAGSYILYIFFEKPIMDLRDK